MFLVLKLKHILFPYPQIIRLGRQGIAGPASSGLGILSSLIHKRIILFYFILLSVLFFLQVLNTLLTSVLCFFFFFGGVAVEKQGAYPAFLPIEWLQKMSLSSLSFPLPLNKLKSFPFRLLCLWLRLEVVVNGFSTICRWFPAHHSAPVKDLLSSSYLRRLLDVPHCRLHH